MENRIHLIMPMGGAGSRFFKDGYSIPKPLIEIQGKPFLYWSTMSILKYLEVKDLTFIVLQEHIDKFNIDKVILKCFENAKIVVLPKVLKGAVLTCIEGVSNINDNLPIIFNDCDHMFKCSKFYNYIKNDFNKNIDGALLTFLSNDNKFSFLELNDKQNVIRTVEKEAISNYAICGAYYFKNKDIFLKNATEYLDNCNYTEYFMSGVYNVMIKNGAVIKNFTVDKHIPFGTPEEYEIAKNKEDFKELI